MSPESVKDKKLEEIGLHAKVHGGGGVSDDFGLANAYAHQRTLRFADGPDEVHRNQIARLELRKHNQQTTSLTRYGTMN